MDRRRDAGDGRVYGASGLPQRKPTDLKKAVDQQRESNDERRGQSEPETERNTGNKPRDKPTERRLDAEQGLLATVRHRVNIGRGREELETMGDEPDNTVTRTMAIPAWMVYGAMMLITVLLGGPVGQLVMVSHHVYENHSSQAKHNIETAQKISNLERDVALQGQKQDDILHAVKATNIEMQELTKTMAVLTSRMP